MLQAVIIYLKNKTSFTRNHPLIISLTQNSILLIPITETAPELNKLTSIIKKASLTPRNCLLITDSIEMSLISKALDITCIGLQASSSETFFTGADLVVDSMDGLNFECIVEEYNHAHNIPTTIATTDRLLLRELTVADTYAMYQLYADNDYVQFLPPLDTIEVELEKQRAYIAHVYNLYRFGLWGVFLKKSEQLIGRCGLQCTELGETTEVELAYLIDSAYSRKGYGYEATSRILQYAKEQLYLNSVIVRIHKDNLPSLQLAKKLGFHFETPLEKSNELIYRIDFNN